MQGAIEVKIEAETSRLRQVSESILLFFILFLRIIITKVNKIFIAFNQIFVNIVNVNLEY
jgi:hypothetical protein